MRAFLLALAVMLIAAAPAYAGSADSTISTPSDPTFPVDTGSDTLTVSGHADFEPIDIICTYGASNTQVPVTGYPEYKSISLQPGGNFSAVLSLEPLQYYACRLHAIPAGSTNNDLSTLTGPRIGVGYRHFDSPAASGYDLELAPFGGYSEFADVSECGVKTTYAGDPSTLDYSPQLFDCSDALGGSTGADNFRAAVQVDGKNAYFTSDFLGFADSSPDNDPATLTVDPSTGLGGASSQTVLGGCAGDVYPPSHANCPDGVADGVRLDHFATMAAGGALALVNDSFASSDGAAHTVDVWFKQSASIGTPTSWRFPGDPAFTDYSLVASRGAPTAPGTTLLDQDELGFGSFSWSAPPDAAVRFTDARTFYYHYSFTLPAGGSHLLRFAYGSSFSANGAAALGAQALASFQQPAAPGGGGQGTPPPLSGTKLRAKFGSVKVGGDGTVTLLVNAPAPGSVAALETAVVPRSAARKKTKKLTVSKARRSATKAGKVKLVLKLNKKGRKVFRAKHKLPVTLTVTYKPKTGSANRLSKHLTLKLNKHSKR